jgi:hypothetical protein
MQCVKILLSCSFCANSLDEDLALSLQRNVSTNSQPGGQAETTPERAHGKVADSAGKSGEKGDSLAPSDKAKHAEKKNKLQEDQDNILEEMQPLIELLKERPDLDISNHLTQGLQEF